jgi:hypothetical protein
VVAPSGRPQAELRCPIMGPDPSSAGTTLVGAPGSEETAPHLPLPRHGHSRARRPRPDAATAVHLASLVGAIAFWTWLDRGLWFFGDEWDFLITRGLRYGPTNPKSIWFPHNEHWSTLPVVLWRGLFNVFHLGSYWPYIVPVLLAQVGVMHLSWRLCRRAGVTPWVATAAVTMLGFLGAGAEDLTWGFQIGFVGSVLFGLLAFDLLDRPLANQAAHRAATLASVALLASLMCSTIGDAMLLGAAVLAFARRPKREAVRVLALPVVAYALWFVVVGRLGLTEHSDQFPLARFTGAPGFVWTGISSALGQAFNLDDAGAAILVGLGAWVVWKSGALWRQNPALIGLCAAVVAFYALTALGRDGSTVSPGQSRYVYVAMALLLPVVAKLLSPAGQSQLTRWAAVALLGVTALGNVGQAQSWASTRVTFTSGLKTNVLAAGKLLGSGVRDVSGPTAAPVNFDPNLSASALADLQRSGWLPKAALTPQELINARTLLAVGDWNGSITSLTPEALFSGKFSYERANFARVVAGAGNCTTYLPTVTNPPLQLWLRMPPGENAASVEVNVPAPPPGTAQYLAAVLAPPGGPSSSVAAQLAVPANGAGYLSDNDPGAQLVITWTAGTPVTLCGLARAS